MIASDDDGDSFLASQLLADGAEDGIERLSTLMW